MGFDDQLWAYLVEEHDAHQAVGPAPAREPRVTTRHGVTGGAFVLAATVVGVVVLVAPFSSGQSAWARQALQRAAAVVIPSGSANTILHIAATETLSPLAQHARETTVSSLSEQAWIQQGKPGAERIIVQVPGGPVLEENGDSQIYNQTTNEVYPAPQIPSGRPHYTLTPTGSGSYRLSATLPDGGFSTETIDASAAQALRDGTDVVQWGAAYFDRSTQTTKVSPLVEPAAQPPPQQLSAEQPDPASTSFVAELRGLLDSGHAQVTQTTTSNGQPAVEISSVNPQSGPRTNYYVNPKTYAPIELDMFGYDSPNDVTRVLFTTYETLPLAGNEQLIRVTVPPTARRDQTPADYWNAAGLPRPF